MINDSGHFFFFDNFIIFSQTSVLNLFHVIIPNVQWSNKFSDIVHHDYFLKITFCFFKIIKLIILQNEIDYCLIFSITKFWNNFFLNKIYQENLIFASLFVIYSKFIFFDILKISKPFQKLVFNNKQFAIAGYSWGSRGHRSAINGCDGSGSHESSETKTTDIKKIKTTNEKKIIIINNVFRYITEVIISKQKHELSK